MKRIFILTIGFLLFASIINFAASTKTSDYKITIAQDFDPLVDIHVKFVINSIRALDKIDILSEADFYVKVEINDNEFISPVWSNKDILNDLNWTIDCDVPDDIENVNITIQLWDQNNFKDRLCDISEKSNIFSQGYDVHLIYNIKTGHWSGDDHLFDSSGYGRLSGCNDKSYYKNQRDCEIYFSISQTDYDGDGIPYWTEVYAYGTDPTIDNTGEDSDNDDIPIEWEHKWLYNPNIWDDHKNLDLDSDSLTNYEEYLTSQWGSDPFRKDIFLEVDEMEEGPNGENSTVPEISKEMVKTAYSKRNIVLHIDGGCMGGGGEKIPFDDVTYQYELKNIYFNYFLHNDTSNWRRSVFRYSMSIYNHITASGICFVGEHPFLYWHAKGTNAFMMSSKSVNSISKKPRFTYEKTYACIIMHETGHTFGIDKFFPFGCDRRITKYAWQYGFWLYGNYKSCMNYRYTFSLLDYSDGSHGLFDYNDWGHLDFSFFEER